MAARAIGHTVVMLVNESAAYCMVAMPWLAQWVSHVAPKWSVQTTHDYTVTV